MTETTNWTSSRDLGTDAAESLTDLGTDLVEESPDTSGSELDDVSTADNLHVMDGTDPEANIYNTELENIRKHSEDVEAGHTKSGEQIVGEMYGFDQQDAGADLLPEEDKPT